MRRIASPRRVMIAVQMREPMRPITASRGSAEKGSGTSSRLGSSQSCLASTKSSPRFGSAFARADLAGSNSTVIRKSLRGAEYSFKYKKYT
jgi:hypothetical protein